MNSTSKQDKQTTPPQTEQTNNPTGSPNKQSNQAEQDPVGEVVETSPLTLPYLGLPTSNLDWSLRSPAFFGTIGYLVLVGTGHLSKTPTGKQGLYHKL